MPLSQVAKEPNYNFDNKNWVVSLIATGTKIGGHAKIIVEGVNDSQEWLENKNDNPNRSTTYVAEYHIIPDANPELANATIPPALRNTQARFGVFYTERPEYKQNKGSQYQQATSRSYCISKDRAMAMIRAIKREKLEADHLAKDYQYAGRYRWVGGNGGHNCVTWAEEKLAIAEINSLSLPKDVVKAIPTKHAHSLTKLFDGTKEEGGHNRYSTWCQPKVIVPILGVAAVVTAIIANKM